MLKTAIIRWRNEQSLRLFGLLAPLSAPLQLTWPVWVGCVKSEVERETTMSRLVLLPVFGFCQINFATDLVTDTQHFQEIQRAHSTSLVRGSQQMGQHS